MNIIYISAKGQENPHTFPTFKKTFELNGHTETINPNEATHCFVEVIDGITEYDQEALRVITERNIPFVCWDSREHGTMQNKKWTPVEWLNPIVYFIRNTNKTESYPDNCFHFDWPYFPECDYEPTTKEELFSRPYDCCLISAESTIRRNLVDGILKDGRLNLNYKFIDHTQRMPYHEWIAEHRKAKLYINCEGGGMTTERPNQLFSCAGLLQVVGNHIPAHPFTDGINCLEISENPTQEDIEKIVDIVNDKDWLWDIYTNGISHTKKYLSDAAVSKYVLKILGNESRH